MTANQLFWTCIAALGIVAAGVLFYSPARAQDVICLTVGQAVEAAEAAGGKLIDLVDVAGQNVDQLLIAEVDGKVQMWGANAERMVGTPLPLDMVKDRGQPA